MKSTFNTIANRHLVIPMATIHRIRVTVLVCLIKTLTALSLDTDGCGKTKGCYRVPDNCKPDICTYLMTWRPDNEIVTIEYTAVISTGASWAAIGLNDAQQMSGTSVADCIVNASDSNHIIIQRSYNEGHDNKVLDNRYLGFVSGSMRGSYNNSRITCRYKRLISINASQSDHDKVRNLTTAYYVLLGNGPTDGNGVKHMHTTIPTISPMKISLLHYEDYGYSRPVLIKVHATLMIIGWMLFASIGILISRYLKPYLMHMAVCGKELWFQVHRLCVMTTFVLTIVGVVLIFAFVGWEFKPPELHPLLGFITACLVVVNPMLALFRPAPVSKHRFAFRCVHGALGHSAHLLAGVAMFFGVQEASADLPAWTKWVVITFLGWRLLADLVMMLMTSRNLVDEEGPLIFDSETFEDASSRGPDNDVPPVFNNNQTVDKEPSQHSAPVSVRVRTISRCYAAVAVVYCVGTGGLAALLMVAILFL